MTHAPQRRKEDRMPGRAGVFFARFFIVVGVAATISCVLLFLTLSRVLNYTPPALPDRILLTHTFRPGLAETVARPALGQPLLRPSTTLHEVTEALARAARDDRVKGFAARMEGSDLGIAQAQELRDAVLAFRKAGKFAWIYGDSFGGAGAGMGDYYVASAFDRILLQPAGVVAAAGLAAEVPFARGFLDKAGVSAQFSRRGKYKAMPESLTRHGMSDDYREMMRSLVGDLAAQMTADIAAGRGMTPAEVRRLLDGAPYNDAEALKLGLVDETGYYDAMLAAARAEAGVDGKGGTSLTGYAFLSNDATRDHGMVGFATQLTRRAAPPGVHRDKARIALIFGAGDIVPSAGRGAHAAFGGKSMAADKVVAAFEAAMDDADVAAIILRIDTPGGTPAAAESIRRAILRAREKGRPVVVSMGSYAASGGYWVAAAADKIVAQPGTVTGSIGVFGGKIEVSGLWDKLGIHWDTVKEGAVADMWSVNRPFTAAEAVRFEKMLSGIYDAFIDRVVAGRGMGRDKVEALAEGRVWTGRQAQAAGLVDALGGLDTAIALARAQAGLPEDQDVPVIQFPPQKSALEMFISLAVGGAETAVQPLDLRAAALREMDLRSAVLRMPDMMILF